MESFVTDPKSKRMPQVDFIRADHADALTRQVNNRIKEILVADGTVKEIRYSLPFNERPAAVIYYEVENPPIED